jgi:acyl-CoA reductase-like NAD-dependent aldehyde dehydrogenase
MSSATVTDLAGHAGMIPCDSPANREVLGLVPITSPAEVPAIIERARAAQESWRNTSFAQRRKVLKVALELILDEADELVDRVVRDSGKTREHAITGEIWPVCEKLRWTIAHGEKHLRPERVSSGMLLHKRARLEYRPLGVLGAIVPWNYPLQNLSNPIIPALFSGNAIVVKPSEWVAWSSVRFAELFRRALVIEGHDPELVQLVQGYGETGQALIKGGIDGLLFIGSGKNGRHVLQAAAERFVPVTLELGGKDAMIVCDDAHLEQALHAALGGTFINAGQNCVSSERLLVFDTVYERFTAMVKDAVDELRQGSTLDAASVGDVVDVGAMITPPQLDLVEELVNRAVESGARVVCGGQRVLAEKGDYFAPTVLADVTPKMEIAKTEVFGPVMLLMRVSSDQEAVYVANDSPFGLGSSVFSKNAKRAGRIADRLDVGMTAINDFGGLTYMAQDLTFGGVKESGYGRMNGRDGLRACCNVKAVLDDRFPIHFPTKLFPVKDNDYASTRATVRMMYSKGLGRKLSALRELLRARTKRQKQTRDGADS